jgi:hypothetical protein
MKFSTSTENPRSYELVADKTGGAWRPVAKRSPAKVTLPGPKQVHRELADGTMRCDTLGTADERLSGRPLLVPVMRGGRSLLSELTARAAAELAALPESLRLPSSDAAAPYPVVLSAGYGASPRRSPGYPSGTGAAAGAARRHVTLTGPSRHRAA